MTHKKYACCCYVCDEDACQVSGCDSNSKFDFGDTVEERTPWSVAVGWVGS
jgi:hypothetical protein